MIVCLLLWLEKGGWPWRDGRCWGGIFVAGYFLFLDWVLVVEEVGRERGGELIRERGEGGIGDEDGVGIEI